jgi:cation:H+ antiporter
MFSDLSMTWLMLSLLAAALVIFFCGVRMAALADRLADRTRLGEAIMGGVLLGAATSLSGSVVSITAAYDGRASLAFSNGVGGIAAQTAFLALGDLLHRRANLEHAAADLANVFQGGTLMLLLSLPLLAATGQDISIWAVHPVSALLVCVYLVGVYGSYRVREDPMWKPVDTGETEADDPDPEDSDSRSTLMLFGIFVLFMLAMGAAGFVVARSAGEITDRTGMSASVIGALLTAVVTSLPELVSTLAAIRQGALQLAVGGIIGGNTFDVLFLTAADVAYREGSLYHAVTPDDLFWLSTGMAMISMLILGMLYRQKHGPAGIGIESVGLLAIYGGAIAMQTL